MTTVVDASVVVNLLVGNADASAWAAELIAQGDLVATHILPVEVANGLRRLEATGKISPRTAGRAQAEAGQLPIELFSYEPVSARVWELRHNVVPYDAWYVAIAELLDAPLATADRRLAAAPGPRCTFLTPPT